MIMYFSEEEIFLCAHGLQYKCMNTYFYQSTSTHSSSKNVPRISPKSSNSNNNDDSSNNDNSSNPFPIILMTPPPFHADAWRKSRNLQQDGRANRVAKAYGDKVIEVSQNHTNCSVLNVWGLLQGEASPDVYGQYLSDGLHLNEKGNRLVHQGLTELIQKEYPQLAPRVESVDGQEGGVLVEGIPLEEPKWDTLC